MAFRGMVLAALVMCMLVAECQAGMPAPLPTNWTVENPRAGSQGGNSSADARWQAISFFVACLLFSAWGVKALWNSVRKDVPVLPHLRYGRALSLTVLWGLCFVVVLTMISGARELMTPGAWKKQGWTYALAEATPVDSLETRRQALERLRFALWQYAATHEGQFPSASDTSIDPSLWEVPGATGLRFLYAPGQTVDATGRLLLFEPDLNGDERLVVLTNGFIGSMQTKDLERLLADRAAP